MGNIPYATTEDALHGLFGRHGAVESASVVKDRETGRPRGFAFVEMDASGAEVVAVQALDGCDLAGRTLRVSEARDRERSGSRVDRDR